MEKFKTYNNLAAKHIILHALEFDYRFCAYSLYNHYQCGTFSREMFHRLKSHVFEFLGDSFTLMFSDDSIDWCVRDFIKRLYDGFID